MINGRDLAQNNKTWKGYTVFSLDFNGVEIDFVNFKDAKKIVGRERKQGALDKEKEIIGLIKKQQKVYEKNVDVTNGDNWQRGAFDACYYLLQLIKELEGKQ